MQNRLVFLVLSLLLGAFGPGCGDDAPASDSGTPPGDSATDGATGNGVAYDDIFSEPCLDTSSACRSSFEMRSACVCTIEPDPNPIFVTNRVGCSQLPEEAAMPRTPEDDDCDPTEADAAPDLSCMMPGSFNTRGEVQMVTMFGVVDVFGNGADADSILVEVYEEGPDGVLGAMLGTATATTASTCAETEDLIDNDLVVGTRNLGFFSIENIPTETSLIVKTSGAPDFWRALYSYNVQLLNDTVETGAAGDGCADMPAGPRHIYDASTLSRSDYNSIPLTAGLPSGITPGNGAVAGEIHDCGDTRLEFAQVGVFPAPETLVYFNDNPSNPLPVVSRGEGTSLLGLFAALDVPPGPAQVAAIGAVDGQTVSLGWYTVQVFPNAVTSLTLRGLRPQQVAE
ncbi:MAG: hypothetical protein JRH11_12025 [Deltaproteobacteria bacterium]|nr:hypothetical protein [Deltaproteobacteria bacterium]